LDKISKYKDKNYGEIDTNNSWIILSNNSNEEIVHKKADNSSNDNDYNNKNIIGFFRKCGIDSIVEEKLNNHDKSNNELNKENICRNIRL
jgi:hypothetical protein